MERYKSIFNEDKELPKEFWHKFGKHLFADEPFKKPNDKDYEKNTREEDELYFSIRDWIKNSNETALSQLKSAIKDFKKLEPYSSSMLQPTTSNLYRAIQESDIEKKFNGNKSFKKTDFKHLLNNFYISKRKYDYKPYNYLQSWTISLENASDFIYSNYTIDFSLIIFTKFSKEELLFNPNFLNEFSYKFHKVEENEIVHIGNKPISVNLILLEDRYNKITE